MGDHEAEQCNFILTHRQCLTGGLVLTLFKPHNLHTVYDSLDNFTAVGWRL